MGPLSWQTWHSNLAFQGMAQPDWDYPNTRQIQTDAKFIQICSNRIFERVTSWQSIQPKLSINATLHPSNERNIPVLTQPAPDNGTSSASEAPTGMWQLSIPRLDTGLCPFCQCSCQPLRGHCEKLFPIFRHKTGSSAKWRHFRRLGDKYGPLHQQPGS